MLMELPEKSCTMVALAFLLHMNNAAAQEESERTAGADKVLEDR